MSDLRLTTSQEAGYYADGGSRDLTGGPAASHHLPGYTSTPGYPDGPPPGYDQRGYAASSVGHDLSFDPQQPIVGYAPSDRNPSFHGGEPQRFGGYLSEAGGYPIGDGQGGYDNRGGYDDQFSERSDGPYMGQGHVDLQQDPYVAQNFHPADAHLYDGREEDYRAANAALNPQYVSHLVRPLFISTFSKMFLCAFKTVYFTACVKKTICIEVLFKTLSSSVLKNQKF